MDWNDLKYVLAVADHGSLNAAAKYLGVNHSTVYRRIQNLEDHLGVKLVLPSKQGYELSEEGELVLTHTKVMAAEADAIELKVGGQSLELSGRIRITAPGSIATDTLPPLLKEFQLQYPQIIFEILETSNQLDLTRREADIAIRGTAKPPEHLIGKMIGSAGWGIYARTDLANTLKGLSLEELKKQDWIGASSSITSFPARWMRKNIPQDKWKIITNSTAGALKACQAGLGITVLPGNSNDMAQITQLISLDEVEKHGLWILMPKELKNSAKVSTLYRFLSKRLASELSN